MDFGILLGKAYQQLVGELHAHLAERGYRGLGASYGYVLRSLAENARTASQLAEGLGISAQGAAKIVDEMVRHGYVERRPDPADKRAKLLHLSDRGRDLLATVREFHAAYECGLIARVGGDQVATVRAVLGEVVGTAAVSGEERTFRPL
ncbi:MarR family transcriptional regulator [Nocardia beijingensis]|uniref:MarR family winged helix-turn-helix transcriptional regulator n=1 Tax=Nocardia beijingensis TaxID=95162 RepID=UPI001894E7B4|nr:MarR family transcriptional regulator [Nocardia beijingensis]MBF6465402.1 MarR family transcriptional regulator [Nocardia beijingensis]